MDPEQQFQDLLLRYSMEMTPEGHKEVETRLWDQYGAERVVFVLDMSGFSLLTRRYGIIHYLSMVRRMQLTVEPIIQSYHGQVVKFEADNCFALFPDTPSAVHASIAMEHAFYSSNLLTDDQFDIKVSIGIDRGRILIVGHDDCFGEAVNRASKLGEDIATAGEILVTRDAVEQDGGLPGLTLRPMDISVSGIAIPSYAVDYKPEN